MLVRTAVGKLGGRFWDYAFTAPSGTFKAPGDRVRLAVGCIVRALESASRTELYWERHQPLWHQELLPQARLHRLCGACRSPELRGELCCHSILMDLV